MHTETETHPNPVSEAKSHHENFHKSLKKPDEFLTATTGIFDSIAKNTRMLMIALAGIVAVIALGSYIHSRNESRSLAANNAMFLAEKSLEKEMKALAKANAPAAAPKLTAADSKNDKNAKPAEAEPDVEAVLFKKVDVDTQFPEAVSKLKEIAENFKGTRSAFEAQLTLGRLYFDHQQSEKALPWLIHALGSAPNSNEKMIAQLAVGHVQESLGKYDDAARDYEAVVKASPQGTLKADVLLSLARTQELLHDSEKAKGLYDQIITQMPGTEYAKTAELLKAQLQ
jgi:TolA-binding protein